MLMSTDKRQQANVAITISEKLGTKNNSYSKIKMNILGTRKVKKEQQIKKLYIS